ncbi:3-oxoacyl-[acyl-carrier-protein] reductase FabG [compost metagenome]
MGCVYATRAFAAHAKRGGSPDSLGRGRIIFIASVAGQVGGVAAEMTYSVSKAGVLCLAKSVARQLGSYGVTVNCISPGTIETDMTKVLDYPETVKQSIALGRYGQVDDISGAAAYLASDDGKYVTGASLDVNGGIFMR